MVFTFCSCRSKIPFSEVKIRLCFYIRKVVKLLEKKVKKNVISKSAISKKKMLVTPGKEKWEEDIRHRFKVKMKASF